MKFMKMKRFGAAVMSGVMALSLTATAFASANVEITGTYEEMEIAVVVPDSGEAQINPYGLPVEITKSDRSKVQIANEQITSPVLAIRNQSTTPLNVNVSSFLVTPKGEMAIGTAKDTGKTAKVELEVAPLNDASLAVLTTAKIDDILIDKFADDSTWSGLAAANKLAAPAYAAGATTAPPPAKTTTPLAVIRAAAPSTDAADAGKLKYDAKSIALFRLKGDLAADPVKTGGGDNPWAAADGFTASIVFTFKPATAEGGTLAVTISGTTATATFTTGTGSTLTVETYEWSSSDTSVATVAGTTTAGTITKVGNSGDTATIKCVATLSNGSKVTGTATYTAA